MDKSRFTNYIQNPGEITVKPDIELIQEILKAYPFFQSAHLLMILGSHQTNSIFYEQTLKISALHAPDREVLMHLVNHPYLQTTQQTSSKTSESSKELEQLEQLIESNAQPLANEQLLQDIQNQSGNSEETNRNEDHSIKTDETEPQQAENPPEENQKETDGEYKQDSGNKSFEEWLSNLKKPSIPQESHKKEAEKDHSGNTNTTKTPESETRLANQNSDQLSNQEILDRFLNSEPRLKRPKAKFYDPNEKAQASVQEDEDLVSEPLAQIHWQQGLYKKAKQIYEKLSLLYPDKFDYFAGKIEEIQLEEQKPK